jgi:hypothetical protein
MIGVVKVYNAAGELVATLTQQLAIYQAPTGLTPLVSSFVPDQGGLGLLNLLGANVPVTWNGQTNNGQFVDSGLYYVTIDVTDNFGKVETWTAPLTVLRTDASTVVEVYNSAGELVWRQAGDPQKPGRVGLSDTSLVPGDAGAGLKISYGSGATDFVLWNGTGSKGQALSGGNYVVKVTQNIPGGKLNTYAFAVVLIPESKAVFDSVVAAPNPVLPGVSVLKLVLVGATPGTVAWGDAYTLPGERVGTLSVEGGGGLRWDIPSSVATGVYLLRIHARDSAGRSKSQSVKVALVR